MNDEIEPEVAKAVRIALLSHRTTLKKALRETSPSRSNYKGLEERVLANEKALNHFYKGQAWQ